MVTRNRSAQMPRNWGNDAVGLFFHDDPLQIDTICDYSSWDWTREAACAGTDPEAWFHVESPSDRKFLERICGRCPVRAACAEHALTHDEHGWWAGMTRRERKRVGSFSPEPTTATESTG